MELQRTRGFLTSTLVCFTVLSLFPAAAGADEAEIAAAANNPPGITSFTDPNPQLAQAVATDQADADTLLLQAKVLAEDPLLDVAEMEVSAYLEPSRQATASAPAGAGYALVKFATGEVRADGYLELKVPFVTNFNGYQDEDDQSLSLLIMGGKGDATVYRRLQVRPPTSPDANWTLATLDDLITATPAGPLSEEAEDCLARQLEDPVVACPSTTFPQEPAIIDECIEKQIENPDLRCDAPGMASQGDLSLLVLQLPAYRVGAAASPDGSRYCISTYYWVRSDANQINNEVDILRTRTGPSTRVAYEWSSASKTATDSAANVGANRSLVAAGYTKTQQVASGGTWTWPRQGGIVKFLAPYAYRPYYLYCSNPYTAFSYYSGVYEWRPFAYRGGTSKGPSETWPCPAQNRVYLQQGDSFWVARETSSQVTGGANIGPVSLRRSQTNSTSHRLTFTSEIHTAGICGKDADPARAKQVREG